MTGCYKTIYNILIQSVSDLKCSGNLEGYTGTKQEVSLEERVHDRWVDFSYTEKKREATQSGKKS